MNTIQNQQSATYIEGMNSTGTADTDNGNDDGTCTQTAKRKGQLYFIITNISKKPNIKSLLRTAFAFGCQTIFVAGQKKFNFEYHYCTFNDYFGFHQGLSILNLGLTILNFTLTI
jgi:hypothetical protein